MKKTLSTVFLVVFAMSFTFAQTVQTDAAHWSLALKGGVDYFNIKPAGDDIMDNASWGAGASLEYTINPLVGVGLNVDYLNFDRSTLKGSTIDPTFFTSFNLSNIVNPKRKSAKLNFYSNWGLGASFGSYSDLVLPVYAYARPVDAEGSVTSLLGTSGLAMEYNVSRALALGLESTYRGYITPESPYLQYNDAYTLMATLRFKFGTGSKTHVRDMTRSDYYPDPAPVIQQVENPFDASNILNRLDNIDRQNQDIQNRLNQLEQDVKGLKDMAEGSKITATFENIEFDFDSDVIKQASYPTLDQIASILRENQTWGTLMINGHTDSVGPESYNQNLSERRAASVKAYLADKGVSAAAMSTAGYGESRPIDTNDTAEGRQHNRRVEFEITK